MNERAPTNLPLQLTTFVGRQEEMAEVTRLLAGSRLLTLTGVGGAGKTRLALEVARQLGGAYRDGAWLVELAPLSDPDAVPAALASVLGIRGGPGADWRDLLPAALAGRELLLVLDNCEHLVTAAAELAETLLRRCEGLRILATSREPLGAEGEVVWTVPPLHVPPDDVVPATIEQLAGYEAARLLLDRAAAARPGLALADDAAQAIAEICRHLDGVPLALELAAARVQTLSFAQIAARLDDRFQLLTAGRRTALPRQQTLRGMVDWSHDLLSEPERVLFRRLSVFTNGWTAAAAEAVGAGEGVQAHAVLELLAQLAGKSLIQVDTARDEARYSMLETIRQYAAERLAAAGEEERTRDRHLAYFVALVEALEVDLRGSGGDSARARLRDDHDNLRGALAWSLAANRDPDSALRLVAALSWFWFIRGDHEEAIRWTSRALDAAPGPSHARMKALRSAGWFAHHRYDAAGARALLDESLALARSLHDRWTEAWVLHTLGRIAYYEQDPERVRALAAESLAIAEEVGDPWLIAYPVHLLGIAAYITGDYPAAREHYERSLALRTRVGDREGIAILVQLTVLVDLREHDLDAAEARLRDAVALVRTMGRWAFAMWLGMYSYLIAARGDYPRAVEVGAAATAVRERERTEFIPLMAQILEEGLEAARLALDEARFAAAWEAGTARLTDDVIAELVEHGAAGPPAPPRGRRERSATRLTPAETEVLRLLASGRTTREIAAELVVAVSTVERHITHIYQKLGVRNRAEATAWALANLVT